MQIKSTFSTDLILLCIATDFSRLCALTIPRTLFIGVD